MDTLAVILFNVVAATVAIVVGMLSSRHLHIWADKAEPPRSPYRDAEPREVTAKTWMVRPHSPLTFAACPKCRYCLCPRVGALCNGIGWFGRRKDCPTAEHLHRKCPRWFPENGCGHRWLEAPADNPEGGEWS